MSVVPAKRRAAALSVASNVTLVIGKLVVGVLTGSVAIISEAIHSGMDLLAAIIAFVAVSYSDRPPDPSHPHGHGKIENLSGAVEALLIFAAIFFIAYEAIEKLIHGARVERVYLGAIVMGISAVVNTVVSIILQRVGKRTESEALLADAAHLRTDVYTSLGVGVGLLLVQLTGRQWLDPVAALSVGLLIGWEAWKSTRRSVGALLDESLPEEEQRLVQEAIAKTGLTFHAFRTRKAGALRTIDLHLDVSPAATAEQVHALCDRVESEVQRVVPRAQVLIHPEPTLEADQSRTLLEWLERILDGHRTLFRSYSQLRCFETPEGACFALRLELDGGTSVEDADAVCRHLTGHVVQHVPGARVYIQTSPAIEGPARPAADGHAS